MFIFILILFFAAVVFLIISVNSSKNLPEKVVQATVSNKEIVVEHIPMQMGETFYLHEEERYKITFMCAQNEQQIFDVSKELWGVVVVGDKGTLSFCGKKFVSFVR